MYYKFLNEKSLILAIAAVKVLTTFVEFFAIYWNIFRVFQGIYITRPYTYKRLYKIKVYFGVGARTVQAPDARRSYYIRYILYIVVRARMTSEPFCVMPNFFLLFFSKKCKITFNVNSANNYLIIISVL